MAIDLFVGKLLFETAIVPNGAFHRIGQPCAPAVFLGVLAESRRIESDIRLTITFFIFRVEIHAPRRLNCRVRHDYVLLLSPLYEAHPGSLIVGLGHNGLHKFVLRFRLLALSVKVISPVAVSCFLVWIDFDCAQKPAACLLVVFFLKKYVAEEEGRAASYSFGSRASACR
jgi:hypothetical protein